MKSVTIEELRGKLDEVIARMRSGDTITITRDGAEIASLNGPRQRGVRYPFRDLHIAPMEKDLSELALQMLIEDRESGR
jgi:antitoxin (DNA-binding transcriptional repressor) of toxin-antitoxin stability system